MSELRSALSGRPEPAPIPAVDEGRSSEHFAHHADIGVRGWGSTPAETLAQAALALTAVVTDLKAVDAAEPAGLPTKVARLQPIICIKG